MSLWTQFLRPFTEPDALTSVQYRPPAETMSGKNEIELALRLVGKGRTEQAKEIFYKHAGSVPDNDHAVVAFGRLSLLLGETERAIEIFSRIVERQPGDAGCLSSLGEALMQAQRWGEAAAAFKRAVELSPEFARAWANLGKADIFLKRYLDAVEHLRTAVALKPGEAEIHSDLAVALEQTGHVEEALICADKATRLDGRNAKLHAVAGDLHMKVGRFDEAAASFEKAIKLDPKLPSGYGGLAMVKKFTSKDKGFVRKTEKLLKNSMSPEDRRFFHFALGKMYNDCKEWDAAFEHYRKANLLTRKPPDQAPPRKLFKQTKKVFTNTLLARAGELGHQSDVPIFIVGMPRSGTTLLEQIIASHPRGSGAGELYTLGDIAQEICPVQDWNTWNRNLTATNLRDKAKLYLDDLRAGREASARVTDKLPENYMLLGLVHLLFPRARILLVQRDPLDVCLSCYFQSFMHIDWAFDFKSIANRYVFYREVMDYWEKAIPPGVLVKTRYEDLVGDTEREFQRVIEACGLDWDPACLEFNRTKRVVQTSSVWQVRQPIYTISKKRWLNYAAHLGDLAQGVAAYLSTDDIKLLAEHGVKLSRRWKWFA